MAFNNENGYDTAGHWNGECFVHAVKRHHADYVTIAEGDSMHFNTGNRDALEYYSARLAYYTDYGPAGHEDFVGVGTLSNRPFSNADDDDELKYIKLPKPDNDPNQRGLNRFMVISKITIAGKTEQPTETFLH